MTRWPRPDRFLQQRSIDAKKLERTKHAFKLRVLRQGASVPSLIGNLISRLRVECVGGEGVSSGALAAYLSSFFLTSPRLSLALPCCYSLPGAAACILPLACLVLPSALSLLPDMWSA